MTVAKTIVDAAPAPKPASSALPPAPMGPAAVFAFVLAIAVVGSALSVVSAVRAAGERMAHPKAAPERIAVADHAEAAYCTPQFKTVLQRVLTSCGLVGGDTRRGCRPSDVKTFASISDEDFNALFTPLKDRGAVVLFDEASDTLDEAAKKLLEDRWADRRGARYFFVVARASKTGTLDKNRALSHRRANSVLLYLHDQTHDPDLDKQVGLLWLGNEFAQLNRQYCDWPRSREGKCDDEAVNRSAFVSWVDCRL